MQVFEYSGEYVPSSLAAQLGTAGVDVLGVTCEEDDGVVVAVQVICGDDQDKLAVNQAVKAYAAPVELPPAPTLAEAIAAVPDTASVADLKAALLAALGSS